MQKTLTIGRTYAVTTSSTCDVTDANGTLITTAYAGQQAVFVAPTTTVTFSDDSASVVAVFKLALAKTRLFEQLGGGRLPAGYLSALFLTTTTSGQGIYTNHRSINGQTVEIKGRGNIGAGVFGQINGTSGQNIYLDFGFDYAGINFFRAASATRLVQYFNRTTGFFTDYDRVYFYDDSKYLLTVDGDSAGKENYSIIRTYADAPLALFGRTIVSQNLTYRIGSSGGTRIFYCKISAADGALEAHYVPVVDAYGVPCMFDKATQQPFYNEGSGSFIVGMTAAQARKLWQLPADAENKKLTISLPQSAFVDVETGEIADADVNAALAYAETKGWVITKQYYTES